MIEPAGWVKACIERHLYGLLGRRRYSTGPAPLPLHTALPAASPSGRLYAVDDSLEASRQRTKAH